MKRVAALAAIVAAALFVATAAAQTGSLAGEEFLANGSFEISQFDCSAAGATVTFTETGGEAVGPYPGTYTETVTLTTGPLTEGAPLYQGGNFFYGTLATAEATFTLVSGGTTITGTKTLAASDVGFYCANVPSAECTSVAFFAGDLNSPEATLRYESQIGSRTSSGDARFMVSGGGDMCGGYVAQVGELAGGYFDEEFLTSNAPAQVPTSVTVSPATATNPVDSQHTVTATVLDQNGQPFEGATVLFTVVGGTATSGSCTTTAAGTCSFTYTVGAFPGTDTITATVDVNGNGSADAGEPTAQATKTVVFPASTPGQTTGGGRTGAVTFTVTARSASSTLTGACTVVDPTGLTVKCLDVVAYVQTGNTSTFYGHATVNGVATLYRIRIVDGGEPNGGHDQFSLLTASGYSVAGPLADGDLQVR